MVPLDRVGHQVGQWSLLANLNHGQNVCCDSFVFYARHLVEQEHPKWLPETDDEPECLYHFVKPSRTTREFLVEQRADPWVNKVEFVHRGQVIRRLDHFVTKCRHRHRHTRHTEVRLDQVLRCERIW